jgi:membrane protein
MARVLRSARRVLASFVAVDPLTLAASVAFYSALSFAPTVLLCLAAAAALWPDAQASITHQLGVVLGPQVRDAAQMVVDSQADASADSGAQGLFSVGALLIAATTAFAQLQDALHRIWGIATPDGIAVRSWIRQRLLSFGIVAMLGFFFAMSLVLSAALALLLVREGWAWTVLNEVITVLVFTAIFTALFKIVPNRPEPWRATMLGAMITALLFECGKWALGAYLAASDTADGYGPAGAIVLLLLWAYYSSLIVLVGAAATRWIGGELPIGAQRR